MSKNFSCRPPVERDGIWMKDRFYGTPTASHFLTTTAALHRDRESAAPGPALPRKFSQLETLRSPQLQFPFTMHDNRYQHEVRGENLKGTYRKARPCCIRREHSESQPEAFIDTATRPTSEQRLQTIARETYRVPVLGAGAARTRRFPHEHRCPFRDGSCEHQPPAQRRCEPASTGPPAAAPAQLEPLTAPAQRRCEPASTGPPAAAQPGPPTAPAQRRCEPASTGPPAAAQTAPPTAPARALPPLAAAGAARAAAAKA